MAYDLSGFQTKLQAAIAALPAEPEPKNLLLIAKAVEAMTPTVAVSDILAASTSQQAIITAQGTAAIGAINDARDDAIEAIQQAGQGSAAASGLSFTPTGSVAATNVQSAIAEVDSEATKKAANLSDLANVAQALQNLGLTDGSGKLLASLLPALAISDVFTVATQAAMLVLTAQRGDVAIRTDNGTAYILATDDPATLANWKALPLPAGVVMQVAGLLGPSITAAQLKTALAIAIADVSGLQTALDGKAAASYATASDIWAGTDTGKIVTAKALRDAQVPQMLTISSGSAAWNAALGFNAKATLTANTTFQTPTNLVEGLTYVLRAKQDATGGRTGSYSSAFNFGTDGAPTLSTAANAEDALTFLCVDATTPRLSFVGIKKGV